MTKIDQEIQKGFELFQSGERRKGIEFLAKSALRYPKAGNVQQAAGMVYYLDAKILEAEIYFKRAYELDPDNAVHLNSLGKVYAETGRLEEGKLLVERSLEKSAVFAESWVTYSVILSKSGEHRLALQALDKAIQLNPENADYVIQKGVLLRAADPEASFEYLRAAVEKFPMRFDLHQLACADANYLDRISENEVIILHRDFAAKIQARLQPLDECQNDLSRPDRPLRIGVLSSDMRTHSVSFFLIPLLKALKSKGHSIFCFNLMGNVDEISKIYQKEFTFRKREATHALGVAQKILADKIDILIETNGLTYGGMQEISALRPAPIIVSAIGYPQTTASQRIQYRLGDFDSDPPAADQDYSEKLMRLDRPFLCYEPLRSLPPIGPEREGPIVFGSFNSSAKINATTMSRWAKILVAVPDSRLVVKSLDFKHPENRSRILGLAKKYGIESRIEILDPIKEQQDHLMSYQHVDIGLDPVPYNGTTTTIEAMLMGVPVICEWGAVHRSRISAMLVKAVGHPEWAGDSEADLIQIAQDLAKNLSAIRAGREELREVVLSSSLCDQVGYAQAVDAAFRRAWREYCSDPR